MDKLIRVMPKYYISQSQADFVADVDNRHPAFVSGLGGGKTFAGCWKSLDLSLINLGLPHLIGEPTYGMLDKIIYPTLFDEILDPLGIRYTWNKNDKRLLLPWGSELWFWSFDNPRRTVGANIASGYIDEAGMIPEVAWKAANSRVRHPKAKLHQLFATFTPEEPGWTHERWGRQEVLGEPLPAGYSLYSGTTFDNWVLEDYAEELASEWGVEESEARVFGKFTQTRSGRVYYAFDQANIRTLEYNPQLPLCFMFDFNSTPGMHVMIGQVRRDMEQYWVLDEVYERGMSLEASCRLLVDRYCGQQEAPITVYGDASGRASASQKGYYEIIKDLFLDFPCGVNYDVPRANPSVKDSVAGVNRLLCNAKNRRSLYVDPRCKRLRVDYTTLSTRAAKALRAGRSYTGPYEIDKTDSNLTHASDAVRYWLWQVAPLKGRFERQHDYKIRQPFRDAISI